MFIAIVANRHPEGNRIPRDRPICALRNGEPLSIRCMRRTPVMSKGKSPLEAVYRTLDANPGETRNRNSDRRVDKEFDDPARRALQSNGIEKRTKYPGDQQVVDIDTI